MKLKIKDKVYDVEITDSRDADRVIITVNGNEHLFGKGEAAKEAVAPQISLPKRDFSSKTVKAALAGLIAEVFVKEGDRVSVGHKLLTLSAMKMENEIVSDFDGKIKEVKVKQNDKVREGDVLITLV
jgi:biotin carboxyl carrier protein